MRTLLIATFGSLSLTCVPPNLEARTMVVEGNNDEISRMVDISKSQLPDREKFIKIFNLALEAKGGKRGGPDVVFSKQPNWYSYLMPYIENAESYGRIGPYKNVNISFLKNWCKAKKHDKLRLRFVEYGYIDERGMPKKGEIRAGDIAVLMGFAAKIFDE
jgi:hypothetical protein